MGPLLEVSDEGNKLPHAVTVQQATRGRRVLAE